MVLLLIFLAFLMLALPFLISLPVSYLIGRSRRGRAGTLALGTLAGTASLYCLMVFEILIFSSEVNGGLFALASGVTLVTIPFWLPGLILAVALGASAPESHNQPGSIRGSPRDRSVRMDEPLSAPWSGARSS